MTWLSDLIDKIRATTVPAVSEYQPDKCASCGGLNFVVKDQGALYSCSACGKGHRATLAESILLTADCPDCHGALSRGRSSPTATVCSCGICGHKFLIYFQSGAISVERML